MPERVVVTGMGALCALGLSVQEVWNNLIRGVSGVGRITAFDPSELLVKIACEVKHFNPENYLTPRESHRRDRFQQFATAVAQEAIQQAGLNTDQANPDRVGVVISSGIGGFNTIQQAVYTARDEGPRRINPLVIPMLMTNGAAGLVGIDHGFRGPAFSVGSACASGSDAIGIAWNLLRSGIIDAAVAGASESAIAFVGIAALDRTGVMSRRDENALTPQPFDLNRDGLVMGEGAAVIILETETHARRRGANIVAELAGYGATADAFHITAPSQDGAGAAKAIRKALDSAGVNPEDVDYINAHGTGTRLNDVAETHAIKKTFGSQAYDIPVSSTKSMTGHIMAATGALEAVFCVQSILQGIIPPTINYQTPDPLCDLDYVPNQARVKPVRIVVSNSFGFGGHNAVLVFRAYS